MARQAFGFAMMFLLLAASGAAASGLRKNGGRKLQDSSCPDTCADLVDSGESSFGEGWCAARIAENANRCASGWYQAVCAKSVAWDCEGGECANCNSAPSGTISSELYQCTNPTFSHLCTKVTCSNENPDETCWQSILCANNPCDEPGSAGYVGASDGSDGKWVCYQGPNTANGCPKIEIDYCASASPCEAGEECIDLPDTDGKADLHECIPAAPSCPEECADYSDQFDLNAAFGEGFCAGRISSNPNRCNSGWYQSGCKLSIARLCPEGECAPCDEDLD